MNKYRQGNQYTTGRLSVDERFWSMVAAAPNNCIAWLGAKIPEGYGLFWLNGKYQGAHRVAYELEVGPIPEGLHLDHLCENPACVNPLHLEPVTHAENKRRSRERRTHCKRGHEYSEINTYWWASKTGKVIRACRMCAWLKKNGAV